MSSNGLKKVADNLESTRRILTNGIWLILVVVILAGVGHLLLSLDQTLQGDSTTGSIRPSEPGERRLTPSADWSVVDKATLDALRESRQEAEEYLSQALDDWIDEMKVRVDTDFLDWYFGYWTQQVLGLKSLWQYGAQKVFPNAASGAEKLMGEIQEEFAQRVLRPELASLELRRIAREMATIYVDGLRRRLTEIPETYSIPGVAWDEYLAGIAITTANAEGNREIPVTLKALTGVGAGGGALLVTKLTALGAKLSAKTAAGAAGGAAAKLAAKTGAKVAAKAGGKFLGAIVGVGVLVWDLWDHNQTEKENRPTLRLALFDYFEEWKEILMRDPQDGLASTLAEMEFQAAAAIEDARD